MYKLFIIVFTSLVCFSYGPYDFVRFNHGARGTALAGSGVQIENDISMINYNPALISTVDEKKINSTFLRNILDINSGFVSYVYDGFEFGNMAFTAQYNNWGSFDVATPDGQKTGETFSGSDVAIGAFVSNPIDENFYYGIGLKMIYSGIDDVAGFAFGVDAGLYYRVNDRTNIGASILNAGAQISKFNGENVNTPLDIRIGANHALRGLPILFNFGFHSLGDDLAISEKLKNINAGAEISFGKYVDVRVGYNNLVRQESSAEFDRGIAGFSFGFGLILDVLNLDYSVASFGRRSMQHRVSVNFDI